MEKVVMSRDEKAINNKIELCNEACLVLQNLYNGFEKIGVTPTIQKLFELIFENRTGNTLEYKIKDLIVEKTEMQTVNGLTMNRSKLIDMLDAPLEIIQLIKDCGTEKEFQNEGIGKYMQISKGIISTIKGFESIISEQYTRYTQNQQQTEKFLFLDGLKESLNKYFINYEGDFPELKGYKFEGRTVGYSVDLNYILRH